VDLADPTRAVTATLDGPVLAVLASAGKPLTVGEVTSQMPRGSEVGVRRSLARLVEQGIVQATEMGRNRVHELNRDHVAAPAAVLLAGLRLELWKRLRAKLNSWKTGPLYACVFGSAARGDGDSDSDIDLLLVHPPFPGDSDPQRRSSAPGDQPAGVASQPLTTQLTEKEVLRWRRQVDELHHQVRSWTGNPLQTLQMSSYEWADHKRRRSSLYLEASRDAIQVAGETSGPLAALLKASG
jgi:DNA-binding GntR family transcriptional regulator